MSCNNSSNINLIKTYITITNGGSRLMMVIPDSKCATGVTSGSVIRFDPTANLNTGQYKLSNASNIASSEVVGIVESINTDFSKNVVIYGSINLPASAIEDIPVGYDGGSGGADIYFLSPTSSGKVRNSAPTDINHVVKPLYQTAPHGNGSYTGIVMNYVGYKINGADLSSATLTYTPMQSFIGDPNIIDPDSDSGIGLLKFMLINTNETFQVPDTFIDASISHVLPATDYPDYFELNNYYELVYTYGNSVSSLPKLSRFFIEYCVVDNASHIVSATNIGKYIFRQGSTSYYVKIIDYDPVNNAYLLSHNNLAITADVTRTSTEQPTWNYGISNSPSGTTSVAGFFKFTTVSPYGLHSPKITYNGTVLDENASSVPNTNIIVLIKVKKDISAATENAQNNTFRSTTLTLENENVNYIVADLETRLQALETRLLLN